jgi:eukaryotic-like serine/threonine-protein kinase
MELEVLGDRYEMQEPIGRGGMATIYRAVDLRMGRVVAAKILREVYSTDPKFVTRFQREARAASALAHPNIVQVFDYGQSGDNYYIVMEYVDGSDLRRYLKKNGILSNDRVIQIAHDVALGLGAAHKLGIVHRDVKPQNIMLNDQGLVKLTDFGIASMYKDAEAERLTTTGMTLGTVQYYAPEQAQGEIVSPAADVYALGIVMYEMLTGRTPFDGDTPVTVAMRHIQDLPEPPTAYNPRITPGLERIILRCLEKDPRDRYRDGNALAYALENLGRQGRRGSMAGAGSTRGGPITPGRTQAAQGRSERGSGVAYGGPAVASNPMGPGGPARQSGVPSQPLVFPEGFGDAPTYDSAFDANNSGMRNIGTLPNGPVGPTVPRSPGVGSPKRPGDSKNRNVPLIAGVVGGAALLLLIGCILLAVTTNGFSFLFGSASPTPTTPISTQQATATSITNTTPTAATTGTTVAQIRVPNVVGEQYATAVVNIENAGLQAVGQQMVDSHVASGFVIKTSPPGGTLVPSTQVVTIYYSAVQPTATATAAATAGPTATATATCAATPIATPTPTPVPGCP